MTWLTDLVDGCYKAWERKQLVDAAANSTPILIRLYNGKYPIALILNKQKSNGDYPTHCLAGPHVDTSLMNFMDQLEPVKDEDAGVVTDLLAELRRFGYNPVVVESPENKADNSESFSDGEAS